MKIVHSLCIAAFVLSSCLAEATEQPSHAQPPHGKAEHVLVLVWDGLRPDSVTEKNTPTLYKLSREGVVFTHHHSVYPTTTEVNGTALATGVLPETSGIIANREFRPTINPNKPVATESPATIRAGDLATQGKYIAVATLAETLQAAGHPTAVAGTKGVALLQDRSDSRAEGAACKSAIVFGGHSYPQSAAEAIASAQGPFPSPVTFPNSAQDQWTTHALIDGLWKNGVPIFSLLWFSDPDFSQHNTAPGSDIVLAALKSNDDNLATVLTTLETKGIRNQTDIFIVSDHGFSTIENGVDLTDELLKAGFDAVRELSTQPKPGQILVVGLGGTTTFYVIDHNPETIAKLVAFLQSLPYSGVICTRAPMPGTFTLDEVGAHSPAAPDVMMAFRWSDEPNQHGIRGLICPSENGKREGRGTHGSLSKFDLHNTLIAAGPDLKAGFSNTLPSGNIDLVPTILWILGVPPAQPLQGRVLSEAMKDAGNDATLRPRTQTLRATCKVADSTRTQYLQVTRVGNAVYLNEGNRAESGK